MFLTLFPPFPSWPSEDLPTLPTWQVAELGEKLAELEEERAELEKYHAADRQRRSLEFTIYDANLAETRASLDAVRFGSTRLSVTHQCATPSTSSAAPWCSPPVMPKRPRDACCPQRGALLFYIPGPCTSRGRQSVRPACRSF